METTFGTVPVFDAHCHFFSHRFFARVASELEPPPLETEMYKPLGVHLPWEFPGTDPEQLADRWVQEMDRHALDRAVLIASVPGDEESVAAAAKKHTAQIAGYFMLNPTAEDAAQRAERGLGELGLSGICLFPAMHHFSLQDPALEPVYQAANRNGAVLFVHCGMLKVGIRDKLGLPSRFDVNRANPLDLHKIARQYPDIRFVIPHFGAGFFRELLMLAELCPNVYTDTSSSNGWVRSMPYPLDLKTVFAKALHVFGPDRLLFGTDSSFFPRGWRREIFEEQTEILKDLGVSHEEAAKILGGNLSYLVE